MALCLIVILVWLFFDLANALQCRRSERKRLLTQALTSAPFADLQRMYQLFKRLPNTSNACGLQPISQIVREHIVDVSFVLSGRCNVAFLHTYPLPYCLRLKKMFAH